MKKNTIIHLAICLVLCSLFMIPGISRVQAAQTLTPYVLTNGSTSDFKAANEKASYKFDSDGTEIFQMNVEKDGALEWRLWSLVPGQVNICLHKKADCSDLPSYAALPCTADRGNSFTLRQYIRKGTYYLKFPKQQNSYQLTLLLYSSEGGTITSGKTAAGYCDAGIHRADSSITAVSNTYSYKAAKNGYLSITKNNLVDISASMSVSFYNSKGKKITDISSDHDISGKITFPVKKGASYKIEVGVLKDGQQFYQMKFDFTALNEKSGSSRNKAASIKLKQNVRGMVYAEESVKTADWYKISLSKSQKLKLTCSGGVISGSLDIVIYDKDLKKIGTYHLMPMNDSKTTYTLKDSKKGSKLAKGTYYIKVVKERKEAAGFYEFSICV